MMHPKSPSATIAGIEPRRGSALLHGTLGSCILLSGVIVLGSGVIASLILIEHTHVIAAVFSGGLLFFPGIFLGRLGYGLIVAARCLRAPNAARVLARDKRPPILFLRSFEDDGKGVPVRTSIESWSFEQLICRRLRKLGPFVAIGRPGEHLPLPGALRLYVDSANWKEVVTRLIDQSQLVVLSAGTSQGLMWELQTVVSRATPDHLALFVPIRFDKSEVYSIWELAAPLVLHFVRRTRGLPAPGKRSREARFTELRQRLGKVFPMGLPEVISDSFLICFEPDWSPVVLQGKPVYDTPQHESLARLASQFRRLKPRSAIQQVLPVLGIGLVIASAIYLYSRLIVVDSLSP
jgi:hypothetical protein